MRIKGYSENWKVTARIRRLKGESERYGENLKVNDNQAVRVSI